MASKRDREKLRSRVKAQLDEEGRSQKDLESALGVSAGTLTRVFSGKKTLDAELLAKVAEGLDADPAALVEGTGWAALLGGSAPPAETVDEDATEAGPEPISTRTVPSAPARAAAADPTQPKPEPRKEPPKKEPAREEPPRRDPPRIEPPPTRPAGEGRKARKRDLPVKALRFLTELIFG